MASLKTVMRRIYHGSCNRSNDKLMNKLKCIQDSSVTFAEHPYVKLMNEKLEKMCQLIGKQCQVVGQHRARRTVQIFNLYQDLYGAQRGRTRELIQKLREILKLKDSAGKRLFLLSAVLFDWNKERIGDDAFCRIKNDMKTFIEIHARSSETILEDPEGEVWEKVVDNENFKLWRCPLKGSSLYKYKVFGTHTDLPASAFYKVQLDLDYRKKWDKYVVKLEKVEHDDQTGSEVIYWATHFPLNFMSSRDYLFVRRCEIDEKRNIMMISQNAVSHPKYPVTDNFVRVDPYNSNMLIKPHTTFNEKGFDYVMYYCDDPKLYVPSWAINKMTLTSLPTFVNTIHEAAMKLHQSKGHVVSVDENRNNNNSSSSMQSRILEMSSTAYNYIETEKNQS